MGKHTGKSKYAGYSDKRKQQIRDNALRYYENHKKKEGPGTHTGYKCCICGWFATSLNKFGSHDPEILIKKPGGYKIIDTQKLPANKEYLLILRDALEEAFNHIEELIKITK